MGTQNRSPRISDQMNSQSDRPGVEAAPRPVLRDIALVIPTVGRPIIKRCLDSIVAGAAWPQDIIVVDQSSSREVAGWLEAVCSSGVCAKHLPSRQRGRASAVNRGIEQSETPFIAVTDDDCTVDRDWLARIRARLTEDPARIVTGRVEAAGEFEVMTVTSREEALYRRPRLIFDHLSGGNMGASRQVFDRVGLLDEDPRLRCAEDGEFAYRALRAGISILYDPEIAVWHFGWREPEERAAQFRAYARSHGAFYGKYLQRADGFIALRAFVHHIRALRRWLRGRVEGDREMAMVGKAYFLGLLPGILSGLRSEPPLSASETASR